MRMSVFKVALAAAAFALPNLSSALVFAAPNCEITKCRGGGNVRNCWASMQKEARSKNKTCSRLVIGSGVSAYAMAMSLPRTCIKPNAVIKIHRPYRPNYKVAPVGSRWHNFYFGRIKPSALNYFKAKNGMRRDGMSNALFMVSVPAAKTGVPLCKSF